MKYLKYILIITGTSTILLFLIVKLYFHHELPDYSGTKELFNLQDSVEVYTDQYGVPHIFAQNNADLFFTAGYITARERLFQLSVLAAVSRGEISSLFGDIYRMHDEYIKENNLFLDKWISLSAIKDENILLINHFCSGINAFINETEKSLPTSFKITKTKPILWTANDVINVFALMANNIKQERQAGLFINTVAQYFGENKLLELFSVDEYNQYKLINFNNFDMNVENQIWDLIGATGDVMQSEVVIIPPEFTTRKKPILIFEDIWGFKQPAKWYDMHLKGGEYNFEGSFIPGFPIPLVGKTESAAWALNGKVTESTVNTLFKVSKVVHNRNDLSDVSIVYSDTTGFYRNQSEDTYRLNSIRNSTASLDNNGIQSVINDLYETKNITINEIAENVYKIYTDNNFFNEDSGKVLSDNKYEDKINSPLLNGIYTKLLENLFEDELRLLGDDFFELFISIPNLAERSIKRVLSNSEISWIDDIRTVNNKESLSEIIKKTVEGALGETNKTFQGPIINRLNGDARTTTAKHILYKRSMLAKIFNLNISPISVSRINISLKENGNGSSSNQNYGISVQRIFDLSDMNRSYSILPTGQSGLPKSIHYSDQIELFNQNKFRQIEFDETTIRNSDQFQKLVLCPVE